MESERAALHRLRLRIGRWLVRPEAERIWNHYVAHSNDAKAAGDEQRATACDYIAIGARYVGLRWSGGAAVSGNDLSATAATPESAPVGPEGSS